MRTSSPLLCAAALAALSCSGGETDSPHPASVDPASGVASAPVRVTIHGDGFLALPSSQQGGGGAAVDTRHRAWLGDVELEAVTWIDVHTLEATVPAGLPAGPQRLVVQNALGRRGALEGAFTVIGSQSAVLEAMLSAAPGSVVVGQPITVTLSVRNTGGAAATTVTPEPLSLGGDGAAGAALDGPSPASVDRLEPGTSADFTWAVTPAIAGALAFSTRAQAVDTFASSDVASLPAESSASAQAPAQLTATIAASRATVNVGQAVTATFTLTNGGAATANVTAISPSRSGTASATCGAPSPAPAPIPSRASSTFTWTCTATTAGTLSMSATATGTDAISGGTLSATPASPANVAVQSAAALTASLAVQGSPTTVVVGQVLSVTLTVSDTGQAGATLTAVAPSPANGCTAPSPTLPQSLAGQGSRSFTWSCTVQAAGPLTLGASVTGTDVNSGATVQATAPGVSLTALAPATLTATVVASRSTVSTGQAVTVSFTVSNGGTSTANISAIARSTTGTAASGTTCTLPSPNPTTSSPAPIAAGASVIFTWSCTSGTAGALSLTGTATGTDAVSGAPVTASPTSPAAVTVQTAATLAVTGFTASRAVADTNQAVQVSLALANSGQAAANLSSLATTFSPAGGGGCTSASPLPPQVIPGGGALTLTWSCTGTAAGSASLSAIVTATDANSGVPVSPSVTPLSLTVQAPASLSATIAASTASVTANQPVSLTLTVANTGGASATGVTVTPQWSGTASAGTTCAPVSPATPQTITGSGNVVYSWTCQTPTPGTLVLNAAVAGNDANTSAPLQATAETGATVTVIVPASFTVASFTSSRATADESQPVTVTLTLTNGGGTSADIISLIPTMTPAGTPGCSLASPTPPLTIPANGSQAFTWTCSAAAAGAYTLGATVDSTPALAAAPTPIPLAVQTAALVAPASLQVGAATINVTQAVTVSLQLTNSGQADANVTSVALSATGTGAVACSASSTPAPPQSIAGGASLTFTWTCTGSTAGTVTLSATATALDANTGIDVSPAISPVNVTVQSAAALTATLGASAPSVLVGTPVTLTLSLQNPAGHGTARVNTVTATKTGNVTCTVPAPVPQDVPGGTTGTVTWTCTPNNKSNANGFSLGATVAATDLNTGAAVPVTVAPVTLIVN